MKHGMVLLALLGLVGTVWAGESWPGWRGPGRDGVVPDLSPPQQWPDKLERVWRVDIGLGHSSPVAADGLVYVLSREGEQEVIRALDLRQGRQVWGQAYDAPYEVNSAAASHGPGPKSTPLVAGGRVYTFGISGILCAWDAQNGERAWQQVFTGEFEHTSPLYGTAMSPLAVDDVIVAHVGGHDAGALAAFDAATGKRRWDWKGDGPAYASPILISVRNRPMLIAQTQRHVVALDPASGRLLWQRQFTTEYDQNSVTPLFAQDLLVLGGYNRPIEAIALTRNERRWEAQPAWENSELSFYMSTPVERNGLLFGFSPRQAGTFVCLDLKTGQRLWASPGRQGDNAALALVGPLVAALTTQGRLVFFEASPAEFKVAADYSLADSPTWASPAFVGQTVLVKDETALAAWRLPQ